MIRFLQVGVIFQGTVTTLQYFGILSPELQTSLGFKGTTVVRSGAEEVQLFRPTGTIGHPNTLGAFLALNLPVTVAQLLSRVESAGKVLPLLSLVMGTSALIMTFSRGSWINFLVGSAVVLVMVIGKVGLRGRTMIRVAAGAIVVATIVLAFSGLVRNRIVSDDKGSFQYRLEMQKIALRMIEDNPWVGVGVNTFALRMAEYDALHLFPQNVVHNVYLFIAAESGVFALLAFVWLLLALAWEGVRSMRLQNLYLSVTAGGIFAGIMGLGLHMGAEMLLAGPPIQIFWFFAGLLVGINRLARRDSHRFPTRGHAPQESPA
jgi:O-antigen ligase